MSLLTPLNLCISRELCQALNLITLKHHFLCIQSVLVTNNTHNGLLLLLYTRNDLVIDSPVVMCVMAGDTETALCLGWRGRFDFLISLASCHLSSVFTSHRLRVYLGGECDFSRQCGESNVNVLEGFSEWTALWNGKRGVVVD